MSPALVKKPILEAEDVGLKTVSIKALMDGNPKVHEDLLAAGVDSGFFYLDCRDHPSGDFLQRIRQIHDAAMEWYDEPQSAKDKWAADHDHIKGEEIVCGYKPAGVHTGPVEGKRDGFEGTLVFEHALNKLPVDEPMPAPPAIKEKCQVFRDTMRELGDMGRVVFESLSKSLQLEGDRYLPGCHRQPESSTTALGMLKYLCPLDSQRVNSQIRIGVKLSNIKRDANPFVCLKPEVVGVTLLDLSGVAPLDLTYSRL
ncbi:uncharacterized protein N7482_009961 [Penicillium canariense]|uniref:Non-haem dioxygenase N-terminal domain-containing protein n=1 Tax=Penicillium canariense TaxID=189055 RepID=A0A9W9HNH5_9EURO|nr:uncharacterized protein N7482_009961 [Penicillium canariense]KAJ5153483.1 hypothetical protein N7482_009961 [Penicillium canariense]